MVTEDNVMEEPTELDAFTWARLAAPFEEGEVKQRRGGGGRQLTYIDARTVQNRLDEVVGARNWSAAYQLLHAGPVEVRMVSRDDGSEREVRTQRVAVECSLTVLGVTKADCGEAEPEEEPFKSAYSDSIKRAAVQFGIGRYLYGNVPQGQQQRKTSPARAKSADQRDVQPNGAKPSGGAPKAAAGHSGERPPQALEFAAICRRIGLVNDTQIRQAFRIGDLRVTEWAARDGWVKVIEAGHDLERWHKEQAGAVEKPQLEAAT